MGASAHSNSLEGSNKIDFTAEGKEDNLFGDEYENKGSTGIAITTGGEGISDFHHVVLLLLPNVHSFSKLETLAQMDLPTDSLGTRKLGLKGKIK